MSQPPIDYDGDRDPRAAPSAYAPASDSTGHLRPAVASTRPLAGAGVIFAGAGILGLLVFLFLSSHRTQAPADSPSAINVSSSAIAPAPPPPSELTSLEAEARRGALPPAVATLVTPPTAPPAPPLPRPAPTPGSFGVDRVALARKSPALVVDLAEPPPPGGSAAATGAARTAGAATSAASGPNPGGLSNDEQFAQRVGAAEPERSRATLIGNARATIPQGAMIPGVLETALNSDLPGFARAVVSRDVRGFDGSTVLIPRGSRIIGQYKSALSQGQSRVFVIWTRIIRPDGATIQIGSPGGDALGRAGLDGKVDRHFFEQFGGSILLSVLNAGVASLARAPSTEVVIGSSAQASTLGASAVIPTGISPTIKVAQGAAIRIFVARDLDFSSVQNAAPGQ